MTEIARRSSAPLHEQASSGSSRTHTPNMEASTSYASDRPPVTKRGDQIVVCARFRPENKMEQQRGGRNVVDFHPDGTAVTVNIPESQQRTEDGQKVFTFDRVFKPNCPQAEVYEYAGRHVVDDVLNGYYATIFAYGQTGSGKTHTMEGGMAAASGPSTSSGGAASNGGAGASGGEDYEGVIPRAVKHIFDKVEAAPEDIEFSIHVSFVEIYMERIRDLLDKTRQKNNLEVRVDIERGVYVDGATEVQVNYYLLLIQSIPSPHPPL